MISHLARSGLECRLLRDVVTVVDDVAATKRAIAAAEGPLALVVHLYGGLVISRSGK